MLMALAAAGTTAILRVPEGGEGWIKRALDTGAAAVMVPRVEDAETAARLAGFATYGPEGRRGEGLAIARAAAGAATSTATARRWRRGAGWCCRSNRPPASPRRPRSPRSRRHPALLRPVRFLRLPRLPLATTRACSTPPARSPASPAPRDARRAASSFPGAGFAELAAMGYTHVADASDMAPGRRARRPPRRGAQGGRPWPRVSSPSTRAALIFEAYRMDDRPRGLPHHLLRLGARPAEPRRRRRDRGAARPLRPPPPRPPDDRRAARGAGARRRPRPPAAAAPERASRERPRPPDYSRPSPPSRSSPRRRWRSRTRCPPGATAPPSPRSSTSSQASPPRARPTSCRSLRASPPSTTTAR